MFEYNLTTWLLLFFIYSFLGWIWESSYVSIKSHKWTNRGFMSGPMLPIYGSGAIIILFTTLPVQDSKVGIYFVGAISATLLELVVGYFIEKIFKVRYWDYSKHKIQYKGYICLSSTIAWGFFSILLVDYLNMPVENFLAQFPMQTLNYVAILILIPFTVDMTKSIRDALDLKELLETMEENNKTVAKLINYVDDMHIKLDEDADDLKEFIERMKKEAVDEKEYSKIVNNIHQKITSNIRSITDDIRNKSSDNDLSEEDIANKEKALDEYNALNDKLVQNEFPVKQIDYNDYEGAIDLLKRNPTANHESEKVKGEMEKLTK